MTKVGITIPITNSFGGLAAPLISTEADAESVTLDEVVIKSSKTANLDTIATGMGSSLISVPHGKLTLKNCEFSYFVL